MKTDNIRFIDVVAAVIITDNGILATQRKHGEFRDKWEFPGGKVEPGETPEEALTREIQEELELEIRIGSFIDTVDYAYPDFSIRLHVYVCSVVSGVLNLKEHKSLMWLKMLWLLLLHFMTNLRYCLCRICMERILHSRPVVWTDVTVRRFFVL